MTLRDLRVADDLVIPAAELVESASRSGGPGGQHVNKANTRVTLRWNVRESAAPSPAQRARLLRRLAGRLTRAGDLVVHASRHRSRGRNRELALERLAEHVQGALATRRTRVATRPGRGARERRLTAKHRTSTVKQQRRRPRDD